MLVASRSLAAVAVASLAIACATADGPGPDASAAAPAILRHWQVAAPGALPPAPAAAVVGSAPEWAALRAAWGLVAGDLPADACDFTVARCLFVVVPGGGGLCPQWSTEEGVDVLTLAADGAAGPGGVHAFVLRRRPAQLAVVLRPAVGAEASLWVDPVR